MLSYFVDAVVAWSGEFPDAFWNEKGTILFQQLQEWNKSVIVQTSDASMRLALTPV